MYNRSALRTPLFSLLFSFVSFSCGWYMNKGTGYIENPNVNSFLYAFLTAIIAYAIAAWNDIEIADDAPLTFALFLFCSYFVAKTLFPFTWVPSVLVWTFLGSSIAFVVGRQRPYWGLFGHCLYAGSVNGFSIALVVWVSMILAEILFGSLGFFIAMILAICFLLYTANIYEHEPPPSFVVGDSIISGICCGITTSLLTASWSYASIATLLGTGVKIVPYILRFRRKEHDKKQAVSVDA